MKPGALKVRVLPITRMSQNVSVLSREAMRSRELLDVEERAQMACGWQGGGDCRMGERERESK